MWRNALFATVAVLMGGGILLFSQLDFLIPYKRVLLARYAVAMAVYAVLLAANLYALFFLLTRKLFLKDTGRKLAHIEKQLRSGSLSYELGERLSREE